jgi:hypothetical protein
MVSENFTNNLEDISVDVLAIHESIHRNQLNLGEPAAPGRSQEYGNADATATATARPAPLNAETGTAEHWVTRIGANRTT